MIFVFFKNICGSSACGALFTGPLIINHNILEIIEKDMSLGIFNTFI